MTAFRFTLILPLLLSCLACQKAGPEAAFPQNSSAPINATFGRIDGGALSLDQYRGRVTLLLFFATYDLASQIAAQRLADFVHDHAPRVNAVAVALEMPKNIDLVRSFREVLNPPFEVVMATMALRRGNLGGNILRSVPTTWILDKSGRKEYEFAGSPTPQQLAKVVKALQ